MNLTNLVLACGWILCIFLGLLGAIIIWLILKGDIDLSQLLNEPNGDASLSRFQFLVFTFVIALSLFLVVAAANPPTFPNIPGTVLALIGISGSSYLVSKGIQYSDPSGVLPPGADIVITPLKPMVRYGQTQKFKADVPRKPDSKIHWAIIVPTEGGGEIDQDGLYKAPDPPAKTPDGQPWPKDKPYPILRATIQATSDAFPDAVDVAVATVS